MSANCPSCKGRDTATVIDLDEYVKGVCDRCLYEWIISRAPWKKR